MDDETDSVSARLDRAQSQTMEPHVVSSDPVLVEVDNEDHGTTHAVLPDLLYCSCEDHQYRGTVCKHLLFLMVQDEIEWVSDSVRQSLADRVLELDGQRVDLIRELEQTKEKLLEIQKAYEHSNDTSEYSVSTDDGDGDVMNEWVEYMSDDDGVDRMSEELLDGD